MFEKFVDFEYVGDKANESHQRQTLNGLCECLFQDKKK